MLQGGLGISRNHSPKLWGKCRKKKHRQGPVILYGERVEGGNKFKSTNLRQAENYSHL